ncbi:unnamed protein product [Paramecium primaurelia]|uniref:COP9 signalosome complex subunit 5 n=1 Tax=Paramecium primaurelia TaxID=5886 RepID=A0A8S1Q8P0_PARPR|nr:unnamed protein product [Paramecium primaurelia]
MQVEQVDYQQFVERNNILPDESIYHFNQDEQNDFIDKKPWDYSPNYFKKCKISIAAVIKMLIHACLGKNNEVMGLMQGRCDKETFIIYDVIYLNAEASEVNVTLTPEAMGEYVQMIEMLETVGRVHPTVGWYHSHPSYGCWLSGTDVQNQRLQQMGYGAFVAVVIDPIRTMTNQKVDIGAFRVYPDGYRPLKQNQDDNIGIPTQKIKDFGAYHDKYYSLDIEIFSNSIDSKIVQGLWERYWGVRLSQSILEDNQLYFRQCLCDLKDKCFIKYEQSYQGSGQQNNEKQQIKEAQKFSVELAGALLSETVKQILFQ